MNRLAIATIVFLLVSACGKTSDDETFFPLAKGASWTYLATTTLDETTEKPQREKLILTNRGVDDIEGGQAHRRRSDSGIDYWLRSDSTGIYRVASKSPLDAEPKPDVAPRFVLRKPYVIGTEWSAATTAYILARKNEVPREVRRTHKPFPMIYRIEALNEEVQTPAGKFLGCIQVAGKAQVRVYDDAARAWRDSPLKTLEWYCPNVGLVRLERKEPSPSRMMDGGAVVLELESFRAAD